MLATVTIPKNRYFDRSEIIPELELISKPYQSIKPIKAGDAMPDFALEKENTKWQQFINGSQVSGSLLLSQLFNKPLVIAFYSNQWQTYGLNLLKQLNNIQHEIKAHGGNLLIISDEKGKKLERLLLEHSLSLNFYFDSDKAIAEKFRIYSDHDPIWNKFSGIDVNVPLLATYVISTTGQIEYDSIEIDFQDAFPASDIISAVQRAASVNNKLRNINNLLGN